MKLMGSARLAAFEAAKREIEARYSKAAAKLAQDRFDELDALDRRYWNGDDFAEQAKAA